MKNFVEDLRNDVLARLKQVGPNMCYDDDNLEAARPKTFDYDSKEASTLINEIAEFAASYMRLSCTKNYALDSAFVEFEDKIRVFFRVFEDADVVLLKLDDGSEIIACVCGLEEMYAYELDDSFDYETDSDPTDENAADDDHVVDTRLWFFDVATDELDAVLVSHIVRAEFIDKAKIGAGFGEDDEDCDEDDDECGCCECCDFREVCPLCDDECPDCDEDEDG